MKLEAKEDSFKELMKFFSNVISWTVFTLLMICAAFLLYYFVSMQLYAIKGDKFEPKFSLYTIISPSMTPNIAVYDVIINLRVDKPEDIKIGDVITIESVSTEHNGQTVTHRVVSIIKDDEGNYSYQTKGDANLVEDSASVPYKNIIGRVALKIPALGRAQLFVASKMGMLLLILIPCLYILLKSLLKKLSMLRGEDSKLYKWANKPLLLGRKPKLLPAPAVQDEVVLEAPVKEEVYTPPIVQEKEEDIAFDLPNIFEISALDEELPDIKTVSEIKQEENKPIFEEDDDDIDLPDLK